MSQTVTQNSVLSQNWVKCTVCTPMAQAACWAGRIMVHQAPCHGHVTAHARLCRNAWLYRSAHLTVSCTISCALCRRTLEGAAACRVASPSAVLRVSRSYHGTVSRACSTESQGRVVAYLATHPAARSPSCHNTPIRIATQSLAARPPSFHDTNDCIVTHPTSQVVRATARPCARPVVSWSISALSQGLAVHSCALVPFPVTIQYIIS